MDATLNESEKAELTELFKLMDTDHSGKIDYTGIKFRFKKRIHCCYYGSKPIYERQQITFCFSYVRYRWEW